MLTQYIVIYLSEFNSRGTDYPKFFFVNTEGINQFKKKNNISLTNAIIVNLQTRRHLAVEHNAGMKVGTLL